MSPNVQDSNAFLTFTALRQQLFSYIPRQYLKYVDTSKVGLNSSEIVSDNGVETLQKLLDNSGNQLRMYETAEDLAARLERYRTFTSSHKYFGMDILEPYNKAVDLFWTLKDEHFMYKQDLFVCFQAQILWKYLDMRLLPRSILIIFLKTHEERLNGCHEFVRHDQKFAQENEEKIRKTMEQLKSTIASRPSEIAKYKLASPNSSFEEIFNQWKSLLPGWTDEQYEPIRRALRIHCDNHPPHIFSEIYAEVFFCTKTMIEMLRNIMSRRPEMYIPYAGTKSANAPITVRVFEDGRDKFVMIAELFAAINAFYSNNNSNNEQLICDDKDSILFTMDLNDVLKRFASQIQKIEFILTPINRCKYPSVAAPLMTPTGEYCILAADAFHEILRRSIFARKIFQKIKNDTSNVLKSYMKIFEPYFTSNFKRRYFIALSAVNKIEDQLDKFCVKFENVPAKDVRNVNKDFKAEDLTNEVKYLGLTGIFPNITDFAKQVKDELVQKNKKKKLTTRDLFDAIESLQTACILHGFPKINEFMHTQNIPHAPCGLCTPADMIRLLSTLGMA